MRVTYYIRCPRKGAHSIERVFRTVIQSLPCYVNLRQVVSRFPSRGFWPRLYNMITAMSHQGDINHITGDVHYLTLFLRKQKTILTIHDCVRLNYLSGIKRRLLWFFWYWLPVRRCAMVTVISESTRRELLQYIRVNPDKITVIHDPLPQGYVPYPKEFEKTKPMFLQVGTNPQKNVEGVAGALAGISCHLRIIGDLNPAQRESLRHNRIEYSLATFLSDAEMIEEYRRCDVVVFTSTYEGFGMIIIEAQAIGRPVVTSNICSMPEVAGGAACLVDPYNIESIRQGILRIINDNDYRSDLIAKGYANVARFRPEIIARQYVSLYKQVLSN